MNEDFCFVRLARLAFLKSADAVFCAQRLVPYFKRVHIERGTTLWSTGSASDRSAFLALHENRMLTFKTASFYMIESGMLRANYLFLDNSHSICESMVAGTIAGDMTFLSRTKRNATVVAERDSVLWKMEIGDHERLGKVEGWAFSRLFEECLLRLVLLLSGSCGMGS